MTVGKGMTNGYHELFAELPLGSFINHVDMAGGRGFTKCPYHYIIGILHFIKWSTKGGEGVKNVQKIVYMVYEWPLWSNSVCVFKECSSALKNNLHLGM